MTAGWLLQSTFIQSAAASSQEWVNAHITAQFTQQNGPSLTLPSDRDQNSLPDKRLISTPLPGPRFSRTVKPHSFMASGSHLGHTSPYGVKSLDRFTRTNRAFSSSSYFTDPFPHCGTKDKKGGRRDETSEEGGGGGAEILYWSHPGAIDRSLPLMMK